MRVRKLDTLNPLYRWRWDVPGMFGYAMTKRSAVAAARAALRNPPLLRLEENQK